MLERCGQFSRHSGGKFCENAVTPGTDLFIEHVPQRRVSITTSEEVPGVQLNWILDAPLPAVGEREVGSQTI